MRLAALILLTLFSLSEASGQYFGRNKPRYREFKFRVKETPHFDLHYYSKNKDVVQMLAADTEMWYDFHSQALDHDIPFLNPIIFYNNHAEFQQTNTISGGIGVGTGGVTEGFKNRVIMPVSFSNQQTYQVLGHELVHAFQFNIIIGGDSTSIKSLSNVPLWIIEGMAEYMSIGRVDPFTAMWMRNAILNDDVPSFEKMASPRYFPYRYGQTAWSFLAGTFGDQTLKPFLKETAKYGIEYGAYSAFGMDLASLSNMWENALKTHFDPYLGGQKESTIGKTLLSKENSGRINVSPSISPNGKWVVYMSEKDLFSTDIFMADARTGNVERKLSSLVKDSDLDNFNFLESAGTWSPDSKRFAFIGFKKGSNVIVIKNAMNGKTETTFPVKGVSALTNPTWSPDGKEIVVTGNKEGQTDLYAVNIRSKRARQLTDDRYSEIQAYFNSNGEKLVFSTDERSFTEGRTNGKYTYDLAIMDYASGKTEILDVFHGADNINATFNHDDHIYFLSDRDGFRNMYLLDPATNEVKQMTDFLTGLSGIARYSPVLTAARKTDKVLFTHYYGSEYIVKQGATSTLLNKSVDPQDVDFSAGTLPVVGLDKTNIVHANLYEADSYNQIDSEDAKTKRYQPKFQLDYIGGGAGVGVSNSNFGNYTGLQGGIDFLFGDMLGNHQLFARASLNGEIYDMGANVSYLNRTKKLAWGVGLSHIPIRTGFRTQPTFVDINGIDFIQSDINIIRIFDKNVNAFAHLPFSTSLRLEGGVNIGHRGFRQDRISNFFDRNGFFVGQDRQRVETGETIPFNQFFTIGKGLIGGANIALVGDNSHFGLTAPLYGQRFRVSVENSFGLNDYYGALADYRKYIWLKPVSIAFRATSFVRFENDVQSIYPTFIGQMGFVRGYDWVFQNNPNNIGGSSTYAERFIGTKMGVTSLEFRVPFTGPKQLALIGSNVVFTDVNFFVDAGVSFNSFDDFSNGFFVRDIDEGGNPLNVLVKPAVAMSVGASVRVNLFGAMILEPYWAYPLEDNGRVVFGLNFIPGW